MCYTPSRISISLLSTGIFYSPPVLCRTTPLLRSALLACAWQLPGGAPPSTRHLLWSYRARPAPLFGADSRDVKRGTSRCGNAKSCACAPYRQAIAAASGDTNLAGMEILNDRHNRSPPWPASMKPVIPKRRCATLEAGSPLV